MSDILDIARDGRVLRVALNRPEKRNALSAELCRELVNTLLDTVSDARTGAILLTANGSAFCAGMDLAELGDTSAEAIDLAQEQLFTVGSRLSRPVIAAVNGPALGGGTGLVANCHIVIAGPGASFGLTEMRLGLWPFLVYRAVTAALGERRALELSLTGRIFGAGEAREMVLVHEVAPDPEARALEIARAISLSSPTAVQSGMVFANEVRGRDWRSAGDIARRTRNDVFQTDDFREGLRAFREKRQPEWPSLKYNAEE